MKKLNEAVKNLLNNSKTWIMSTKDTTPNAVPLLFKKVANDDTLVLFDVFMKKSIENIKKNGQVAITVYDENTLEGYQLKGTATHTTDANLITEGNTITNPFKLTTKGALLVKIDEVFVLTPGPDNGKTL